MSVKWIEIWVNGYSLEIQLDKLKCKMKLHMTTKYITTIDLQISWCNE